MSVKSKLIVLGALFFITIALAQYFLHEGLVFENKKTDSKMLAHDSLKIEPAFKNKQQATPGDIFLSEINPAEDIGDFNNAFSESLLIIKVYESSKRSNRIDESDFLKNRNDLARAYSILLALKMAENGDGERVILREIDNCAHLIRELIDR